VSLERTGEGGVALRIQVPEGWALYTPSPGPLGLPLEVSWAADGVPVSLEPAWPSDEPYPSATGTARVFRGPVVLRVAAEALPPGVGTLAASARWAVCRDDLCVPGRSDAELTLRR
jgi:DsbC/DsbD-like thiol-disulfide interchange protein